MTKKAVILGAAESGAGAARLAKVQGYEVFVSDYGRIADKFRSRIEALGVEWEEGQHTESKILAADVVIKSPGIPGKAPIVQKLREAGVQIVSEIEFASWFTEAKIVGITGSNGKTTVTSLIGKVMADAGLKVAVGGNIGRSFAELVAEGGHEYYVLEISSFQLDDIDRFRPDIAVLTNITEDHLDRYNYDFRQYADAKFKIAANQGPEDVLIVCGDDPGTMDLLPEKDLKARVLRFGLDKNEANIAWIENNTIYLEMDQDQFSYDYERMRLRGKHNAYNTMAAAIVAKVLDLRKDTIRESFTDFRNVEHRLEKVAQVGGVEFINDSKATNVNAAWYALESVESPIVWIAGGVDKGNDYEILWPLVEKKVKSIVALGEDVKKIHKAFSDKVNLIINAMTMEDAVRLAYHLSDKGDTVLLSPACASFDLFDNYEDRGRKFKHHVKNL